MPTIGISAFLKLICLNVHRQKTEVRHRISPSGDGYDFHRSLKILTRRFLISEEAITDVLASLALIAKEAERKSALAGLEKLGIWRASNLGEIVECKKVIYRCASGLFNVSFEPTFGIVSGGKTTAIHLWNTANPPLIPRMVYAALSLFPDVYAKEGAAPDDLAILSLRDGTLYRLSEAPDRSLTGVQLIGYIEKIFRDVRDESAPPAPPRDKQPPAPPP